MAGGAVIWITGIPAAGKTTLALALRDRLEQSGTPVGWIDGDQLRAAAGGTLGFARADRSANASRAARLAQGHAERGAVAVVSLVSPYRADRDAVRRSTVARGIPFVEVFLDISVGECRRRDPKGLYAAAAAGRISGLTGWDDPYEPPEAPEVHLTEDPPGRPPSVPASVAAVLDVLAAAGVAGLQPDS